MGGDIMINEEYLIESARTDSPEWFGDEVGLYTVIKIIKNVLADINDLDVLKKKLFYNRIPYFNINEDNIKISSVIDTNKLQSFLHGVFGMVTESGEMLELLLKTIENGDEVDEVNLFEELGDSDWYKAKLCRTFNFGFEEIMDKNINKLKTRYPEKFSIEKANNRNLNIELKVLKKDIIMKKYEFTGETETLLDGTVLHRIKRLSDGLVGGWIESEDNLSHKGSCFVYNEAMVFGQARVFGKAKVYGEAWVFGQARVCGEARVYDKAKVFGEALVYDKAKVYGKAWVFGQAEVFGLAQVYDKAMVFGLARVYGEAMVFGKAKVFGETEVFGLARVYGEAMVFGKAWVYGKAEVYGEARVYGEAEIFEGILK